MLEHVKPKPPPVWRQHFVLAGMIVVFLVLALRVVQIQTQEVAMLREEGDKRYLREIRIVPERGKILDRNGRVLALSTPVSSLSADPKVFCRAADSWAGLPQEVGIPRQKLIERCGRYVDDHFMYIRRRLPPAVVDRVLALNVPGLEVDREYMRYYPGGPVGGQLLGLTDIDENGVDGLELAYDAVLKGREGRKQVLKDRVGHMVEGVRSIQPVDHGDDLTISIDYRVQSLASRYLETAVRKHDAAGGSVVILGVPSGEIIAMVNSPQFNPNDRKSISSQVFRNTAVTDTVEPGSTAKPFTIAMALESGRVDAETVVDTSPGHMYLAGYTIRDVHDYGPLSVHDVLVRSSNIGTVKVALELPFASLFDTLKDLGFGRVTGALPGETGGVLEHRDRTVEHATMSYGYGFSVTPLQLAQAYTVFATDGKLLPISLERKADGYRARGKRVFRPQTVALVRRMLNQAASSAGTASKAPIPRYHIGGKTGTTRKLMDGNYQKGRYVSLFAGLGPLSEPRFVTVVSIDDPKGKWYYGGDVAAPVFSKLMSDLMRLYNIRPDNAEPARFGSSSVRADGERT